MEFLFRRIQKPMCCNQKFWRLTGHDIPQEPGAYILSLRPTLHSSIRRVMSSIFYIGQSDNLKRRLTQAHKHSRECRTKIEPDPFIGIVISIWLGLVVDTHLCAHGEDHQWNLRQFLWTISECAIWLIPLPTGQALIDEIGRRRKFLNSQSMHLSDEPYFERASDSPVGLFRNDFQNVIS